MIIVRKAKERGHNTIDWLDSYHTFSFADYYDENWMGFGMLRVINEDYIKANQGFDMHPHRNMEILTYVIQGALHHKDTMGNSSVIKPGEIQRMSAGTGVRHSEFNHSQDEELHLLQIWVLPEKNGITPSYEQKQIQKELNQLILIGSDEPTKNAVTIHQHINIYVGYFEKQVSLTYLLNNHMCWLQVIHGDIKVNDCALHPGDGMAFQNENELRIECLSNAEFLFFEMK